MTIVLRQVILKRLTGSELIMTLENLQKAHLNALQLLQTNSIEEAKKQLLVLANQNFAPAMTDLAMVLLMYATEETATISAINYLKLAEAQNYSPAIYYLATISVSDAVLKLNWNELNTRLLQCCLLENPNALCDAALLFAQFGSTDQKKLSTPLLELSAMKGNSIALALLGERLANGYLCDKDQARANSIRRIALRAGLPVSEPIIEFGFSAPEPTHFLPVNKSELNFNTELTDQPILGECIDTTINLRQFPEFFTAEECLYIRCMGAPFVRPSVTVDEQGQTHQNKIRSSFEFMFQIENESVYLKLLQRRMAKAVDIPLKNAEQLILLRYTPGQEYKPHRDYLPPSRYKSLSEGGPGQRLCTVITYLNEPAIGGETTFPLLKKLIKPKFGLVICFDNINKSDELNESSLHAGLPVQQGVKWICTLWIHQSTYRLL